MPDALERFQSTRREDVEKTQYAANVSALWTENPARYWGMEPIQACFSMLSRAKAVTYENLRMRDPQFVDNVQSWFAGTVRKQGFDVPPKIRRRRCSRHSGSARWWCRTGWSSRR